MLWACMWERCNVLLLPEYPKTCQQMRGRSSDLYRRDRGATGPPSAKDLHDIPRLRRRRTLPSNCINHTPCHALHRATWTEFSRGSGTDPAPRQGIVPNVVPCCLQQPWPWPVSALEARKYHCPEYVFAEKQRADHFETSWAIRTSMADRSVKRYAGRSIDHQPPPHYYTPFHLVLHDAHSEAPA